MSTTYVKIQMGNNEIINCTENLLFVDIFMPTVTK